MNWHEAIELERQVFGGSNVDLAVRLMQESRLTLMYLHPVGGTDDVDDTPPTEAELDEVATLIGKAELELGGE